MMERGRLPRMLLVSDVAEAFQMHPTNVRRLLKDGRLRGYRLGASGSRWRIPEDAVVEFVEGQRLGAEWLARWRAVRDAQDAA